jgi:hypothetical protein
MTKKIKIAALLLILIIIMAAIGVYAIRQELAIEHYQLIGFDQDRAYADEEALLSFGPRLSGTDAEYRGALYIEEQFKEAGLSNVHIEDYSTLFYEVHLASVSLIQYLPLGNLPNPLYEPLEYAHTVDFVVQGYSGSFVWTTYLDDLEMADVGDGENDGLWEDAQGKAAIVTHATGVASNTQLFFKASDFGVSALILHNTQSGEKIGYLPFSKSTGLRSGETSYPDIPFFMVSKAMGDELKDGMDSGMKLRLNFDCTVENRNLQVVLGDVEGSQRPKNFVMLGAHHDTVYNGPGAVDNTVGTVTVIELARQLVKYDPKCTIRLVTWGGEEEGLFGSYMYFEAHEDEVLSHCKMYLNFDMNNVDLARGNSLPISVADNASLVHMKKIAHLLEEQDADIKKYDIQLEYYDLSRAGSDQHVFANNDIMTAACWGSGSWEYHTYLDTIEHVNPESLSVGGRIFGSYALYLANK